MTNSEMVYIFKLLDNDSVFMNGEWYHT